MTVKNLVFDKYSWIQTARDKVPGISFVYAILGDGEHGNVKFGTSDNPLKRFKALQTANANKLQLLGVMLGDSLSEKRLQNLLDKASPGARMEGEWYYPSKPVMLAVEFVKDSGDALARLFGGAPTYQKQLFGTHSSLTLVATPKSSAKKEKKPNAVLDLFDMMFKTELDTYRASLPPAHTRMCTACGKALLENEVRRMNKDEALAGKEAPRFNLQPRHPWCR